MARKKQHATVVSVPVPPPDPRPYVPHITLPQSREVSFLALHDAVVGYPMHWLENQHIPHPKERDWCAGCRIGQTPRWEGYIGVLSLKTLNRFILRLPAAAFRESGMFRERSDVGILAGTVFTAWRFGPSHGKNRPAVIEIEYPPVAPPKVKPFPLLAALSRYWRMETLDGVEQIKRPEDMTTKLAQDLRTFAQAMKERAAAKKGGQS